jgi:hypothetical protein
VVIGRGVAVPQQVRIIRLMRLWKTVAP